MVFSCTWTTDFLWPFLFLLCFVISWQQLIKVLQTRSQWPGRHTGKEREGWQNQLTLALIHEPRPTVLTHTHTHPCVSPCQVSTHLTTPVSEHASPGRLACPLRQRSELPAWGLLAPPTTAPIALGFTPQAWELLGKDLFLPTSASGAFCPGPANSNVCPMCIVNSRISQSIRLV